MTLDHDICYRAVQSRDARFDGKFFTAVKTTGIYCRPVCPATTPYRRNVRFFACAAAAEHAGFRPCKRCRPETAPGTPAWSGTSATVARALRLIGEGCLDDGSVDDLAARLGLGARQLNRLFANHLGAGPVAVAQTRRVHFARELIAQSDLPMTQIALSAGFGSIRRFNTLIKQTFGATPSELRERTSDITPNGEAAADGGALVCRLPYRPPYDWAHLVAFLRERTIPGVETFADDGYARTVCAGDAAGVLEVMPSAHGDHLRLRLSLPDLTGAIGLVARVRRMFDCAADPAAIGAHLAGDPWLKPLVRRRPGLRLPSAWDPFEMAVRTILGQQVSVAAATTVSGRLVARCGTPLTTPASGLSHLFPTPAVLAAADLDGLGLTTRRAATVRNFARTVATGEMVLEAPDGPTEFATRFAQLPGIGPWTAQYVAMRALGEPDAFPASDLGLRQAMPDVELAPRSAAWSPWRSYAALHLWASLADDDGVGAVQEDD